MEWIYPGITLLSLIVAVLAATNKLVWAKEYRDAKDETIKAKEAQIELLKNEIQNLREFTSSKVRESFIGMKQQLEEYIEKLQQDLEKKNEDIVNLQKSGEDRAAEVQRLTEERTVLSNTIEKLESVVDDQFIGDLIRRSFFGYDVSLKGDLASVRAFVEKANQLGESKGGSLIRAKDHEVVQLSYANSVSADALEGLANELGLQLIEIKKSRGFTF